MQFHKHQKKAKYRTFLWLVLFVLSVFGTAAVIFIPVKLCLMLGECREFSKNYDRRSTGLAGREFSGDNQTNLFFIDGATVLIFPLRRAQDEALLQSLRNDYFSRQHPGLMFGHDASHPLGYPGEYNVNGDVLCITSTWTWPRLHRYQIRSSKLECVGGNSNLMPRVMTDHAMEAYLHERQKRDLTLFWSSILSSLVVIVCCGLYKLSCLPGGASIAALCGARPLATDDLGEHTLLNVVEEMAVATGSHAPAVYVLDEESGINAFVAGYGPDDMVLVITRGAIDELSRDELQGVVAHEFGHVRNDDMRLHTRLIALVFGISCLAELGRQMLPARAADLRHSGGSLEVMILGSLVWLIGGAGKLCAEAIQASVSRQRELLADASAVQYTRNPSGIAGALKKIAHSVNNSYVHARSASQLNHLMMADARDASFGILFNTHPPLVERIRILDPSFRGDLDDSPEPDRVASHLTPTSSTSSTELPVGSAAAASSPPELRRSAGFVAANAIRQEFPGIFLDRTEGCRGADGIVYALLLSVDESMCQKQLIILSGPQHQMIYNDVVRMRSEVQSLSPRLKLPLACLCSHALQSLPPGKYNQFKATLKQLGDAFLDNQVYRYALMKIVCWNLDLRFQPKKEPAQAYSMQEVVTEVELLLSVLAIMSSGGAESFLAAVEKMELTQIKFQEANLNQNASEVDSALEKISLATAAVKERILKTAGLIAGYDGKITLESGWFLQVMAEVMDLPPPASVHSEAMKDASAV